MSSPNNLSGLTPAPFNMVGIRLLPTRSEKKIIPVPVPITTDIRDFSITAALQPFVEYVLVRFPGRGKTATGVPDPASAAYFQFLINPASVKISKQTLDEQTFTRAGWQIGVQGEDFTMISMEGTTPGEYFSNGLTDIDTVFSMSYRNLTYLEQAFENNGYWYEGEQISEGPLASGVQRQIKMHQDVELVVGEFIWNGMFDSFTVREDAATPFTATFTLTFVAWQERFLNITPYPNSIGGQVQRGHVPLGATSYLASSNPNAILQQLDALPSPTTSTVDTVLPPSNVSLQSVALPGVQPPPGDPFPWDSSGLGLGS